MKGLMESIDERHKMATTLLGCLFAGILVSIYFSLTHADQLETMRRFGPLSPLSIETAMMNAFVTFMLCASGMWIGYVVEHAFITWLHKRLT
jgi:hypothetical protein